MTRKDQYFKFLSYHTLTVGILCFGVGLRIYCYIHHKDLWLDEAMLAYTVYGLPLSQMFFQPLPHLQAAPLGFLLVSKALGYVFGYGEYTLYFLPLLCGIGSLLLAYRIGALLFDNFGQCFFVTLCVGSLSLLYYSTEFKQYGIEAFCSFLVIYIYLKGNLKCLCLIAPLLILFSNTIIFIWTGCMMGYLYQHKSHILAYIKYNLFFLLLPCAFFLLYYVWYIRFQAVDNFYDYWGKYFLPHTLSAYPSFIKEILLPLYGSFIPFKNNIVPYYVLLSFFGLFALIKGRRDLGIVAIISLSIYIALSLLRIYPFGHEGVIGSRLSLWISVIFYLCCTYGLHIFYQKQWLKLLSIVLLLTCLFQAVYKERRYIYKNEYHIQQSHALITTLKQNVKKGDCIWVYNPASHAFDYYSFIDKLLVPYEKFDKDLSLLTPKLKSCTSSYIFASHYSYQWINELKSILLKLDPHASIKESVTGWGAILAYIHNSTQTKIYTSE